MKRVAGIFLVCMLILWIAAGCGSSAASEPGGTFSVSSAAGGGSADTGSAVADPPGQESAAEPSAETDGDSPAGCYKMTEMLSGGQPDSELEELSAMGLVYYFVLEEDGTGYFDLMGEQTAVTWDESFLYGDEDTEPAPYTCSGDTIIIGEDGETMTMVRLTEEEQAYYEEHGSGDLETLMGALGDLDTDAYADYEFPEGSPSGGPVSGTVSGYEVTVVSAERAESDENVVRIYYDFTNTSDEAKDAFTVLYFDSVQDGERLETTYNVTAVPEDENDWTDIEPGETIRCACRLVYNPEGGTIGFRVTDLFDEDNVYYYIDPAALK